MKTIEFMVACNEEYLSDIPYRIVDAVNDEFGGYEIYRVTTDDASKIRVINETTGVEYIPDTLKKTKHNIYCVTIWSPIN